MKILRNVVVATVLLLGVMVVRAWAHEQSCSSAGQACGAYENTNMIFPNDPDYWCTHNLKHWFYQCINVVTEEVLWQGWCEENNPVFYCE